MVLAVVWKNVKMAGFGGEEVVFSEGVRKNNVGLVYRQKVGGVLKKLRAFLPMKNGGLLVKNVM